MANLKPIPFPFVGELFAKALIKRATTGSASSVMQLAVQQRDRSAYILRVLEASADIRAEVRTEAIANVAADPTGATGSEGQKQLVCILTAFELFSAAKKEAFINSFKTCATLAGQGPLSVASGSIWQPGHIPPRLIP